MAENPLDLDRFHSFARLTGLRLVPAIYLIGGLLEQPANKRIGRFENGCADQDLQLGDSLSM